LKYSILKHNNNPDEEAPKISQKILAKETEVQQKSATESEASKGIVNLQGLSLQDLQSVINRLTLVQTLNKTQKKELVDVNLNLEPAVTRCDAINGPNECVPLWGAFAVKRCLRGYVRFGCCQCVLPCPPSNTLTAAKSHITS